MVFSVVVRPRTQPAPSQPPPIATVPVSAIAGGHGGYMSMMTSGPPRGQGGMVGVPQTTAMYTQQGHGEESVVYRACFSFRVLAGTRWGEGGNINSSCHYSFKK